MVNRTTTPIRITPGQVLALGKVIPEIEGEDPEQQGAPEDQDKSEPSNPEPDGPVQSKD